MTDKIGRNDPCWCGSGRKYKNCHIGRSKQAPVTRQEIVTNLKSAYGKQYCLHPEASDEVCSGTIVKAHSIQRGGGLERIARDGHVYGFIPNYPSVAKDEDWASPRLVGINKASTFSGFCSYHDNKTFKPIETGTIGATREHAFLLAYRALCRELFKTRARKDFMPYTKTFDRGKDEAGQVITQQFFNRMEVAIQSALRRDHRYKISYDEVLLSSDYSEVRYYVIALDRVPDFLCSGFFMPEYDFQGRHLQDCLDLSVDPDHLSFSLLPTNTGGVAVLSWLGECPANKKLVQTMDAIPDNRLPNAIARFSFQHFENVYANPDWWDSLSSDLKSRVKQRVKEWVPKPECLQENGVQYVSWQLTSRETNVRFC